MRSTSFLKKTFSLQQDQSDCGVACLLSLINYYQGSSSLEKLRELSGTSIIGTTLLGLYQTANQVGFHAEAFEADMDNLKKLQEPCILHVLIESHLQHYVICYGFMDSKVIIGDPDRGIIELDEIELEQIWQSKALLQLQPNENFIFKKDRENAKWIWFKQLIKEDLNILTITIVLGIIVTILNLATAIFSQQLIDKTLPSGDQQKLITSLALLLLVLLIRAGLSFVRQHFLLMQSRDFNNRILGGFFEALVYLPKSFFDSRKSGDMITRMNDTGRIQKNIAYISGSVFIDLIILIVTAIFLINYSLTIALVTLGVVPIIFLIVFNYTKPIKTHQRAVMVAGAHNESNYIDTIDGIMVIKSHHQEEIFTDKIKTTYAFLQNQTFALGKLGNRFNITTDVIGVILSVILITIASFMVLKGQLKIGEMMAILALTGNLIPAVARLAQINLQMQEAKIAFDRMYDFTSIPGEYENNPEINKISFKTLTVKDLEFRFPGRKAILSDINFEIKKGEIISILGESGSGKSTTIAILEKFYTIDKGSIQVNGEELNSVLTPSWRNIVASVPQEVKLFNGTLIENIAIGYQKEETLAIVNFCHAHGFDRYFEGLPQGYFTLVGEEGINLSGGQKQLVALARALYRRPQLLLLDEATAAMDRNTERFILNLLKTLRNDLGIVMVTHKMQTAKIADRIYIIENGKISASGTPNQLLETDNFFSQLVADSIF